MSTPSVSLAALMMHIDREYQFINRVYPTLTSKNNHLFVVRHTALHMNKAAATVAAEAEVGDHGRKMNDEKLKEAVIKQLINSLKLASHLGMEATDIEQAILHFWE